VSKSRSRDQKKPKLTIKERRAEKRAKFSDEESIIPKRKQGRA
jgi:hypothetical protein